MKKLNRFISKKLHSFEWFISEKLTQINKTSKSKPNEIMIIIGLILIIVATGMLSIIAAIYVTGFSLFFMGIILIIFKLKQLEKR